MQWTVGNVKVTMIRESISVLPLEVMYPEADRSLLEGHEEWLERWIEDDVTLPMSIHALVLESEAKTIMIDTCNGTREVSGYPDLSNQPSAFLDDLAAAGYKPEDIDVVVCTHLHIDHVGWNTTLVDGAWVPTFPNARYLFSDKEYQHWAGGAPGAAWTFEDAVRPLVEQDAADRVEMDHRVTSEISFEPTPGHSPGHISVRISSQGADAIITGDLVHHPIQFIAPNWRMFLDGDPDEARRTRNAFMDRYTNSGVRIFGTHFPGTSTGFLERTDGTIRFGEPT